MRRVGLADDGPEHGQPPRLASSPSQHKVTRVRISRLCKYGPQAFELRPGLGQAFRSERASSSTFIQRPLDRNAEDVPLYCYESFVRRTPRQPLAVLELVAREAHHEPDGQNHQEDAVQRFQDAGAGLPSLLIVRVAAARVVRLSLRGFGLLFLGFFSFSGAHG